MTTQSTTMTARTPEDVLAVVPVVLGFEPHDSLVMLTFGADPPFHARVDLPNSRDEVADLVESLLAPARQHRARQVFLIGYGAGDSLAERCVRAGWHAFERAGIAVIDGLRTDGRRWFAVPGRRGVPAHGVPYDLAAHPFAAQAVYDGRVVHDSRDDLRAMIAPDPAQVGRVVAAVAELTGDPPPILTEGSWVRELVVRCTTTGTSPDDHQVARLLRGLLEIRVRDAAWSPLRRDCAREHVAFWVDVVRRAPEPLVAAPAALLAFAAWQSGEGALAWCAVDRSTDADPDYSLACLVAQALVDAVPPHSWQGDFDWTEGLFS
ncbi:DUF4192 domain-containing protein [Nocardioides sp. CN2-186]|uniref:DUF4192 domain-containing protein n=1 Tax=Nocardioides tweenelious TaxID=3156607 RepID=UPI0032B4A088